MSHVISTRLSDERYSLLDEIAQNRRRSLSEVMQEALDYYLADYADYRMALDRLYDHKDEIIDGDELKQRLGWNK